MKLNINGNEIEVSDESLSKALEDKQESFEVKTDDLVIRTTEQQTTYEDNLKKEVGDHKVEIGRKEVLAGLGIEIEGKGIHKSLDKSLEAINGFIGTTTATALADADKEPNGKIKELTTDLETLRGNLALKDGEIETAKGEFASYKKTQKLSDTILDNMPENTILPKKDIMSIVSSQINLDINESGQTFGYGQDGQPLKDGDRTLLSGESIVKSFFDNNPQYVKPASGGAGGADSTGKDGKLTWDGFVAQQKEAGNNPSSEKFTTEKERLIASGGLVM